MLVALDATIDDVNATLYIVLLDWSRAFDRIRHDSLIKALQRFGIRGPMLELISAIYTERTFSIRGDADRPETFSQAAGIAQGCPLSPYLFIIVMSVALLDAKSGMQIAEKQKFIVTPELVYADDTMLLGSSAESVQRYLDSVIMVGRTYGLELNMDKSVLLRVRGSSDIYGSDGSPLKAKTDTVYLGGLISTCGDSAAELSRRLGEARRNFHNLAQVWKHANIPRLRKLQIFNACIVSKALYGLDSIWLLKHQLRKLDAFYCSCLRKIAAVPPSMFSRVSNADVLRRLHATPLSQTLRRRQLVFYRRLVHLPEEDFLRMVAIEPHDYTPRNWNPKRRVGRPCERWCKCVYEMGLKSFNNDVLLFHDHLASPDPFHWRTLVRNRMF